MTQSIKFLATIGLFALSVFILAIFAAYRALENIQSEAELPIGGSLQSMLPSLRHESKKQSIRIGANHDGPSFSQLSDEVIKTVQDMRLSYELQTIDETLTYDIHKCPPDIPEGYPKQWNVIDVLSHWNPDDTKIPSKIYQGFCELDWSKPEEQKIAESYRKAEMPFVIRNHSTIWEAAERWSDRNYLSQRLQNRKARNEYSTQNQMPYWKQPRPGTYKDWTPPTKNVELTFDEWYEKSMALETADDPIHTEHWYFRLNADYQSKERNRWVYKDLPFFIPEGNFFMVDPEDYRGVNCRLGAKGIIAHAHYDNSRNFILLLKGQKRYILADPNQCENMELYPREHPSARHSSVNWSDPDAWQQGNFPKAQVNEVVLQAGDIMYLPTAWFHYIVSLNMNYQCNARSGVTHENEDVMKKCGFHTS